MALPEYDWNPAFFVASDGGQLDLLAGGVAVRGEDEYASLAFDTEPLGDERGQGAGRMPRNG